MQIFSYLKCLMVDKYLSHFFIIYLNIQMQMFLFLYVILLRGWIWAFSIFLTAKWASRDEVLYSFMKARSPPMCFFICIVVFQAINPHSHTPQVNIYQGIFFNSSYTAQVLTCSVHFAHIENIWHGTTKKNALPTSCIQNVCMATLHEQWTL